MRIAPMCVLGSVSDSYYYIETSNFDIPFNLIFPEPLKLKVFVSILLFPFSKGFNRECLAIEIIAQNTTQNKRHIPRVQ